MRENERNEKERELLKGSRPEILFISKKVSGYSDGWDLYTVLSQEKLQKSLN